MLKLGRQPRIFNPAVPHMSALFQTVKPIISLPAAVDYSSGMPDNYGMMLNDRLGCCTIAAYYHAIQIWSFCATHKRITEPDGDVLKLYEEACGYDPQNPDSDQGGVEQNVLKYLVTTGAVTGSKGESRHKLRAFFEVDPRNTDDIRRAIYECGGVYIGFIVPQNIMPPSGRIPSVWKYERRSPVEGGHAIFLPGYDKDTLTLISWGKKYRMTWEFFQHYTEETYALVDIDWFQATGKTLLGLSIKDLEKQMEALCAKK